MTTPAGSDSGFRESVQYVARRRYQKRWKRSMGLAHGTRNVCH